MYCNICGKQISNNQSLCKECLIKHNESKFKKVHLEPSLPINIKTEAYIEKSSVIKSMVNSKIKVNENNNIKNETNRDEVNINKKDDSINNFSKWWLKITLIPIILYLGFIMVVFISMSYGKWFEYDWTDLFFRIYVYYLLPIIIIFWIVNILKHLINYWHIKKSKNKLNTEGINVKMVKKTSSPTALLILCSVLMISCIMLADQPQFLLENLIDLLVPISIIVFVFSILKHIIIFLLFKRNKKN